MRKIFRYEIPSDNGARYIDASEFTNVIRVDEVDGVWNAWAVVDPDERPYSVHCIRRIPLPVKEKLTLRVPKNSIFVHAQDVDGLFYIWIQYHDNNTSILEDRKLVFYKTGQQIDCENLSPLIGTCKLFIMQELCLYVFEDLSEDSAGTVELF